MKYKEKDLEEFKVDQIAIFHKKAKMLVWDDCYEAAKLDDVIAIVPERYLPVITKNNAYQHCAMIPTARTNWDVYCENKNIRWQLDSAVSLIKRNIGAMCIFCPAHKVCKKAKLLDKKCDDIFEDWANAEADDE